MYPQNQTDSSRCYFGKSAVLKMIQVKTFVKTTSNNIFFKRVGGKQINPLTNIYMFTLFEVANYPK